MLTCRKADCIWITEVVAIDRRGDDTAVAIVRTSVEDDKLPDLALVQGQPHEAFVYFPTPDGKDSAPPESFTTLWYGPQFYEFPIILTRDRRVLT